MSTIAAVSRAPGFPAPAVVRRPERRTPSAGAEAGVRLTRRGRLVVLAVFVVATLALLAALAGGSAATGERGEPAPTRSVEVGAGDTLWEIAADVAEPGEVRAMVYRIEELNALPGPQLAVGQELAVPVG